MKTIISVICALEAMRVFASHNHVAAHSTGIKPLKEVAQAQPLQQQARGIDQGILGMWKHGWGTWSLEFAPNGQATISDGHGNSCNGIYENRIVKIDVAGSVVLARVSVDGNGDLVLEDMNSDRETPSLQMYGSDGRAIFYRQD